MNKAKRSTDVTSAGSHYLKDWQACPAYGAYSHIYPHPNLDPTDRTQSYGLSVLWQSIAPATGSAFHDGMEAYYTSRVVDGEDTGEPNVELAMQAIADGWEARKATIHPDEDLQSAIALSQTLMSKYHAFYGPGGVCPEYPNDLKIAVDTTGEPIIERYFEMDLGNNMVYTCRIDLVAFHQHDLLVTLDHKTSKASFAPRLLKNADTEAQFTGNLMCLMHETGLQVNTAYLSVSVKDRSPKSSLPAFERKISPRSDQQIEDYFFSTVDLLNRIQQWKQHFQSMLDEGIEVEEAFRRAFPKDGTRNERCTAYGKKCEYYDICRNSQIATGLIGKVYRPKVVHVEEVKEEEIN